VAQHDEPSAGYLEALRRGFAFARELGRGCGPVDVLVGICEGSGPAAAALDPGPGRSLRSVVAAGGPASGGGAGYLHLQAQEAAGWLAETLGQQAGPEHLLIALLDQGTPEVVQALNQAGLDRSSVRRAALAAIGAPADHPPVGLPSPAPAGTMDRPPLPADDLDPRAWAVLRWRQDHLPLQRLRRPSERAALARLERTAAWRLAERLGLSDDQRYSLIRHHAGAVSQAMARAAGATRPGAAAPPHARFNRRLRGHGLPAIPLLRVTVGWGVWVGNRRNNLRYRWVWLRTRPDYRGCPQP
jgi:hypothetical protein